jgi:hypothetical protein
MLCVLLEAMYVWSSFYNHSTATPYNISSLGWHVKHMLLIMVPHALSAGRSILITLSHQLSGRLGLLEREAAAVLNAALQPLAARVIPGYHAALQQLGLGHVPLYLTGVAGRLRCSAGLGCSQRLLAVLPVLHSCGCRWSLVCVYDLRHHTHPRQHSHQARRTCLLHPQLQALTCMAVHHLQHKLSNGLPQVVHKIHGHALQAMMVRC